MRIRVSEMNKTKTYVLSIVNITLRLHIKTTTEKFQNHKFIFCIFFNSIFSLQLRSGMHSFKVSAKKNKFMSTKLIFDNNKLCRRFIEEHKYSCH